MRNLQLLDNASRALNKVAFQIKKHSPAILVTVGAIGTVAGTVMACKATLKVNEVLKEHKETSNKIHEVLENPEIEYNEKDCKKDLAVNYAQTGVKLAKLYGPSVLVLGLSITSMVASYRILNTRNLAISAAYTLVDKSFKEYRDRVKDRFGEQVEKELKYNIKAKTMDILTTDEVTGEEIVETKTVEVIEDEPSEFARFFDESSECWTRDANMNLMFLRNVQEMATRKLKKHGSLSINEVYRMLGFHIDELPLAIKKASLVVGWVYDPENPERDNKVDFGIYDVYNRAKRDFVNGYEKRILIDFNYDGNIYELMA